MSKLTKNDVAERIAKIKEIRWNDEVAHGEEDSLFHDFVECIKNKEYGSVNEITAIAKELLKVRDVEFGRYYE